MANQKEKTRPHALMFPHPVQGHINPMMQLAMLLLEEGFFITFVNTEHNHERMFKKGAADKELCLPNFRFELIDDGLPPEHMRVHDKNGIQEFTVALLALPGPFAKLVRQIVSNPELPPLTCIIVDSFCSWMQDVADQFRIPRVSLWTTPVHANLAYIFQSTLISHGLIPVTDKSKLAEEVKCIEGIAPMKLEDYICFFLANTSADFLFQWHLRLGMKRAEDALWNLGNNVEEFESETVKVFKQRVPNFLTIGPLFPTDVFRGNVSVPTNSISLWPEDARCLDWLSQHETGSIIYISFGSIVNMHEEELANIILGLEESGSPFLWAVRPEQGGACLTQLRARLDAEAADGKPSHRALIVAWAPQLAILAHPSVGLFLSHCGWNSLFESLAAGVPILAKPGEFAEQRMNAHYVEEVWKVGLRLPSTVTKDVVKSSIHTLLGKTPLGSKVRERAQEVRQAMLAGVSRSPIRGSSYSNLRLFVDDMHKRAAAVQPQLA